MLKTQTLRFFGITFLATVMTVVSVFLGAPLLRVMRNVFGSKKYWLAGLLVSGLLIFTKMEPFAILTLSVWSVVGFYSEVEERGYAGIWMAGLSVIVASAIFCSGMYLWASSQGTSLEGLLNEGVQAVVAQINAGKSPANLTKVDPKLVLEQTPSAIVLLLMMSLAFALMLDRRAGHLVGLRFEKIATHLRLLEFRLPDVFIWVTMFSFLFSFLKIQPTILSVVGSNVFNVMMGLYFFQGLAVLEVSFLVFRVGSFTKFLVYFFIVGQLFLLLSAVGVIDYWVDFRSRMRRLRRPERNQKNGEHV